MKWSLVGRIGVARMSQAKQFFGQTLNFSGTSEWPKYKKIIILLYSLNIQRDEVPFLLINGWGE